MNHLAYIKSLGMCVACGAIGEVDVAHVRLNSAEHGKFNTMGRKPDDRWTLPLCPSCHRGDQHTKYGEPEFWDRAGIDPLALCKRLWEASGNVHLGIRTIMRARLLATRLLAESAGGG